VESIGDNVDLLRIGVSILSELAPEYDRVAEIRRHIDALNRNHLDPAIRDLVSQDPGDLFAELMGDTICS
jgi:hypothetical protein